MTVCESRRDSQHHQVHVAYLVLTGTHRLMLFCVTEHLPDQPRTFSDVLVHNGRGDDFEEVGVERGSHGSCQQRLARSRWSVEQHSLGRLDADPEEQLGVHNGKFDDFSQFSDLLAQTADSSKRRLSRILHRHVVHHRVDFSRQNAHDGERRHVQ